MISKVPRCVFKFGPGLQCMCQADHDGDHVYVYGQDIEAEVNPCRHCGRPGVVLTPPMLPAVITCGDEKCTGHAEFSLDNWQLINSMCTWVKTITTEFHPAKYFTTSCGDEFYEDNDSDFVDKFKWCPYCGDRIKFL